jgi:aspartyl protease family protein
MSKSVIVLGSAVVAAVAACYGMLSLSDNIRKSPDHAATVVATSPTASETQSEADTGNSHLTAIPKAADGHFWANAVVNSKAVRLLVDTGATVVVLTPADAQRLGFDVQTLPFDHKVSTANGETTAALVNLAKVGVGQSEVRNVDALVVKEGLETSLLGMSYLGRLSRFEATPSSLILHP